jgi:hypothetical protein
MHILFYVPDNQVTRNFIPQLWPFLLQALTPKEHRVTIIDGNAQHLPHASGSANRECIDRPQPLKNRCEVTGYREQ